VTRGADPILPSRLRPRLRGGRLIYPLPGDVGAVLFDLDGLLIDSEPLWARAEAALVEGHGGRLTPEDRLATIGRSVDASLAIYAERLGMPADSVGELHMELLDSIARLIASEGQIRPGAAELVDLLGGRLPLAVASNSEREIVTLALDRIGLAGRFDTVVSAEDVARPKPAPDVYLEACRRLAVDPSTALGFEDSPAGIEALHAAGATAVGVLADGPLPLDAADLVVDSLEDVVGWVDTR
jgi:HAD superfamily hydrolase (TIGR01509 family)